MSKPELKMENFDVIRVTVSKLRTLAQEKEAMNERTDIEKKKLRELGITCYNDINCSEVGKLCFKCKNNNARRSYFRDLLQKDPEIAACYAADASFFDAAERGE